MGSINKSHNEADGGVLLFNGELILIYCDSVNMEIGGKESSKGRIYLTTHRIIFVAAPMKPSLTIKSVSAPFFALSDIKLEQPVFGANYITARVRDEVTPSQSFTFKLNFSKGGAIEFAMAMTKAASAVSQMYNPRQAPPAYTASPLSQYYQAPPNVFAPGFNCGGFQMPQSQSFNQPGASFIYASPDPPPYPGFTRPTPGGPQVPMYDNPASASVPQYPGGMAQQPQAPSSATGQPSSNNPPPMGIIVPQGIVDPPGFRGADPASQGLGPGNQPAQGNHPEPRPPSYEESLRPQANSSTEPSYPTAPPFNPEWASENKKSK